MGTSFTGTPAQTTTNVRYWQLCSVGCYGWCQVVPAGQLNFL
jgi:hypothetical protein